MEKVVDRMLECARSISELERQDQEFEETTSRAEGCFPFFTFSISDQVVGMSNVEGDVVAVLKVAI